VFIFSLYQLCPNCIRRFCAAQFRFSLQ